MNAVIERFRRIDVAPCSHRATRERMATLAHTRYEPVASGETKVADIAESAETEKQRQRDI